LTSLFLPWAPAHLAAASITYDAVGAGVATPNTTWSHTAAAGAYVLAFGSAGSTNPVLTYGATTMPQLGSQVDLNGAYLLVYGLAGVAGGAQTITESVAGLFVGNSISFTGVTSAGTPQTYQSTSTTAYSQSVTCTTGQVIVQSFEDTSGQFITSSTGGTSRYFDGISFTIRTATANTTFTATLSTADGGAGIAVVLS
jgi:hypothetical protein